MGEMEQVCVQCSAEGDVILAEVKISLFAGDVVKEHERFKNRAGIESVPVIRAGGNDEFSIFFAAELFDHIVGMAHESFYDFVGELVIAADIEEVDETVRQNIKFVPVERVEDIINSALVSHNEPATREDYHPCVSSVHTRGSSQ